ncbi:hypothetical protein QFZ87_004423 [Bacillus sp. SLBN-46]|uniref:nitrous oxide-stimulated promoter family protein n=1 Tax=Bacillus sp. SLBN-46 TaxID=3042283 RepID=UPI002864A0BA|nr:nitrous oxide-stimulated promoter family protein [Bacillus sp. SLBN-46]MDR6124826.1 hypothetical protein [Bacillus sp. SLBN-46]
MRARLIEPNNGPVIQKEKEIVKEMIELYCKKKHHREVLCKDCQDLKNYALLRLSFCRFGEDKTACSNCKVHCYKLRYREKMKAVMRYSGKWMMLYHPIYSVKHLLNK